MAKSSTVRMIDDHAQREAPMILNRRYFAGKTLAIIISLGAFVTCQPISQAASPVTVGGPFTLTAPDGSRVTDQTYKGKWMLVYFGYTSCPDSCPLALAVMAATLKKLGPEAEKLQAIFITLDPRRDTPEVMGEYVQSFDPRMIGLTGSEPEIDAAAKAYGAYYVRHSDGTDAQHYVLEHSTYIYLMSPRGAFVRAFDADAAGDAIAAAVSSEIDPLRDESHKRSAQIK